MVKTIETNSYATTTLHYDAEGRRHRARGPAVIEIAHSGAKSYKYYQRGRQYRRGANGHDAPHTVVKCADQVEYYYNDRVAELPNYVRFCANYVEMHYGDFRITMGGGSLEILNNNGLRLFYYSLTGNITLLNGLDRWHYDYLNGHLFILNSEGNVTYLTPERANNYILPRGKISEIPISAFESFFL